MKPVPEALLNALETSPPVRGRGLKQSLGSLVRLLLRSPPVRGRGLKHGGGEDR